MMGTGMPAARAIKVRLPNMAAKTPAKTSAGTESMTIACHLTVDRSTGNAAVQERDAAIWFNVRRRETSAAAANAQIVAQKTSCRWNHASVDIAAARWACTYIDADAIQAMNRAIAAASTLCPRRRPRFTHTRYLVDNTGAFASRRLITRSTCVRHASPSRFMYSLTATATP